MRQKFWDKTCLPDGTSHADWLEQNAHEYTVEEAARILGRSKSSTQKRADRRSLEFRAEVSGGTQEGEGGEIEGIPIESLLQAIKDKPRTLKELSLGFDRSEDTIRRAIEQLKVLSYEITQTEGECHLWSTKTPGIVAPSTILWDKETWRFKLGLISDSHWGSKASQMSGLIKAVDIMYDCGIRDILHCGDLNAGRNVYKGQELDNVTMRADEQLSLVTAYWPKRDGLRYRIMGGNHDWSLVKHGGFNAVKAACKAREDFTYCGFDLVTVPLTDEIDAMMWHPSGGQAYAMSYRSQKMVEQIALEQLMKVIKKSATPRVRFLFVGHWHGILMGYEKGPIHIQHPGSFEGETNLSRRMGAFPQISAVILEGEITKDRNIIRDLTTRRLRFTEIEDDYLNYPIPQEETIVEPLFQWDGKES